MRRDGPYIQCIVCCSICRTDDDLMFPASRDLCLLYIMGSLTVLLSIALGLAFDLLF